MKKLLASIFHIIDLLASFLTIFTMFLPLGSYVTADGKTITVPFLQAIFGGTYSNNGVESYFNTNYFLIAIYAVLLIAFIFSLITKKHSGFRILLSLLLLAAGISSIFTLNIVASVNPHFVVDGINIGLGQLLLIIGLFVASFSILLMYALSKSAKNKKK